MHATEDDHAQNTFEYLLVIGAVVLPLVGALLGFDQVVVEVVGYVCPAVDTANPLAAVGSCLGIS